MITRKRRAIAKSTCLGMVATVTALYCTLESLELIEPKQYHVPENPNAQLLSINFPTSAVVSGASTTTTRTLLGRSLISSPTGMEVSTPNQRILDYLQSLADNS